MQPELIDVLIVEDENELAQLHAELIDKHPRLRLAGIASTLADARQKLNQLRPQLLLLDNYLPDGKGITLISDPLVMNTNCSVIFITAASDMDTCSLGLSKTTARRYVEHGVETGFLRVEMLYGKPGHPRRMYRLSET